VRKYVSKPRCFYSSQLRPRRRRIEMSEMRQTVGIVDWRCNVKSFHIKVKKEFATNYANNTNKILKFIRVIRVIRADFRLS
jgi:hypothetical protein